MGFCLENWEQKKTSKQKTHKHFSDGPCGTIVPGTIVPSVPATNGTKWRFYCGIKQKKAGLSQGRVPFCPGTLFVPDTVPPQMFIFIGFFLPEKKKDKEEMTTEGCFFCTSEPEPSTSVSHSLGCTRRVSYSAKGRVSAF